MFGGQSCPTCTPPTKKWFVSDPPGMAGNAQCGRKSRIEMAVLRYFAGRRRLRYRRCLQDLRTAKGPPRGVPEHPNHARLGNATVRGYNSGNSLASQSRRVKPRFEAPPNGCFPEAVSGNTTSLTKGCLID